MSRKRTLFLFLCLFVFGSANILSYSDNWPNGSGGSSTSGDESSGDEGGDNDDGDKK